MVHSISTREVIVCSSRGLTEAATLFKNLMEILRNVICCDGTLVCWLQLPCLILHIRQFLTSPWEMMKEILLCSVNFRNNLSDLRVLLYLNDCSCKRKYCRENAAYSGRNQLIKVLKRRVLKSGEFQRRKEKKNQAPLSV